MRHVPVRLLPCPAVLLLGAAVPEGDHVVQVAHEDRVVGQVEQARLAAEVVLVVHPFHELANLAAHRREEIQLLRIGLADLAAEELDHAEKLAREEHGEADRAAQLRLGRALHAHEARVRRDVGKPQRRAALPHRAGQPATRRKYRLTARRAEWRRLHVRHVPDRSAPQRPRFTIDDPERAPFPSGRLPDDAEEVRRRAVERGGLGQDARDGILHREALVGARELGRPRQNTRIQLIARFAQRHFRLLARRAPPRAEDSQRGEHQETRHLLDARLEGMQRKREKVLNRQQCQDRRQQAWTASPEPGGDDDRGEEYGGRIQDGSGPEGQRQPDGNRPDRPGIPEHQ